LNLGHFGNQVVVFLNQVFAGILKFGYFPRKPLNLIAQVCQIIFRTINLALGLIFFGFLFGNFLVFLPALEFYVLNGGIQFF
jgi:hypothetical protein